MSTPGYVLAGAYVYLLAAGAVHVESSLAARPGWLRRRLAWTAVATVVALPIVLPVLPASDIGWTYKVNSSLAETVGWPELVRSVDYERRSLPASQRHQAIIFTADYGEAAAINELGRADDLPIAVSGQNNEWYWGPGNPNATTVVAVAPGPMDGSGYRTYLAEFFKHVRVVATLSNDAGIHNQEWGGHIYVCIRLRRSWVSIWPELRHYD